jgi:hypothetical protein
MKFYVYLIKQKDEIDLLYNYSRDIDKWKDEDKKSYIEGKKI